MATAAAIDRVVHHSVIPEFDVPSYRTDTAQQRGLAEEVNRQTWLTRDNYAYFQCCTRCPWSIRSRLMIIFTGVLRLEAEGRGSPCKGSWARPWSANSVRWILGGTQRYRLEFWVWLN